MCRYAVCCSGCGTIDNVSAVLFVDLFEEFDDAYEFAIDDARNIKRLYLIDGHDCDIDTSSSAVVLYLDGELYYRWQILLPNKRYGAQLEQIRNNVRYKHCGKEE